MSETTLVDVRMVVQATCSELEEVSPEMLQEHYARIVHAIRSLQGATPPERVIQSLLEGVEKTPDDVSTIRSFVVALHRELNPHCCPVRTRRCVAHG